MTSPSHKYSKISLPRAVAVAGTLIAIGGSVWAIAGFFAPLRTLPLDVKALSNDINTVLKVQAVQAESLKTLAEVASDTKTMRRDVDAHTGQIEVVKQRLSNLEAHR